MTARTKVRFLWPCTICRNRSIITLSVLGMNIDFTAPGGPFLSRESFRLMLGECTDAIAPADLGDHSYYGDITVSDADALYEEYRRSGVVFTQHLASKPWGMREFGVRTIDGHRIMFGQEL